MSRYRFRPQAGDTGRVDVLGPGNEVICWLPARAAQEAEGVYRKACEADWIVANEFMAGFLFGIHHAFTSYGNSRPTVDLTVENGVLSFAMVDDAVAAARRGR